METGSIISIGGLIITIIGFGIGLGGAYQKCSDQGKKIDDLDKKLTDTVVTAVENGNRITRLETQFTLVMERLTEILTYMRNEKK